MEAVTKAAIAPLSGIKPVSVATYVRHVRCFVRFCEKRGIMKKVEIIFGRQIKLSEITEDQTDLFYLALLDMRDMKK